MKSLKLRALNNPRKIEFHGFRYYSIFDTTKNGLLFGFVYVAVGACVADSGISISKRLSGGEHLIAAFVCIMILLVEYFFRISYLGRGKSCDITFALLPLTVLLLAIAINVKGRMKLQTYELIRSYSILVFLIQRMPLTVFRWIDSFTDKVWDVYYITKVPIIHFVCVFMATIMLAFTIIKLTKRYSWIKKFIL